LKTIKQKAIAWHEVDETVEYAVPLTWPVCQLGTAKVSLVYDGLAYHEKFERYTVALVETISSGELSTSKMSASTELASTAPTPTVPIKTTIDSTIIKDRNLRNAFIFNPP
jgi:hypothetical protein